jgi:Tfp pilus assembly protein PilF
MTETTLSLFFGAVTRLMKERLSLRSARIVLPLVMGLCICQVPASGQDSGEEGTLTRGSRAELAITVRDDSGQIITSTATVKLYNNGIPIDQSSTSRGRAFFVLRGLGDFSVVVEASGYKTAQKDVNVSTAIKVEVDVTLERNLAANESGAVPGEPLLAPKAKEALVKGLQAMGQNKLDEAQRHMSEAMKLAPSNPEVLYVQGMLYMKRNDWADAQTVLEKSDQLDPNHARVLAALGMALCNQRKYEQAIPPLEKSLRLETTPNWQTQWTLSKAYYYHEQYDQALAMAQQAKAGAHGSAPQIDLVLAQCLTAEGRYEDSAHVLREFLKNNPDGSDAVLARHWLDGLAANGKIRQETNPTP